MLERDPALPKSVGEREVVEGRPPFPARTLLEQRVLLGTLATMVEVVEREQPTAPTLIIVGDVVRLHEDLAWFGEA